MAACSHFFVIVQSIYPIHAEFSHLKLRMDLHSI